MKTADLEQGREASQTHNEEKTRVSDGRKTEEG